MEGSEHLEIHEEIDEEIDKIINDGVKFNVLNPINFDIEEDVRSIKIKSTDRYTFVGYSIDESTGKEEEMGSRTIIGAILKAYDTYNRVSSNESLNNDNFNPVNFSYTTPGKNPVYLISLILMVKNKRIHDKYDTVIFHLGTYNKVHRDALFNIYGFQHSKLKMEKVNELIPNTSMITDEDHVINAAWNADSAAMHENDKDIADFIGKNYSTKEGYKSLVEKIDNTLLAKKIDRNFLSRVGIKKANPLPDTLDLWIANPDNVWKIDAALKRYRAPEASVSSAARAAEQKAFLTRTNRNVPMTAAAARAAARARAIELRSEDRAAAQKAVEEKAAKVEKAAAERAAAAAAAAAALNKETEAAKQAYDAAVEEADKAAKKEAWDNAEMARVEAVKVAAVERAAAERAASDNAGRGGKRRKTKRKIRKSKTHKRKSNKKMRRSRKSRRRHKKK